jgi:hypothetical protein
LTAWFLLMDELGGKLLPERTQDAEPLDRDSRFGV